MFKYMSPGRLLPVVYIGLITIKKHLHSKNIIKSTVVSVVSVVYLYGVSFL